MFKKHDLVWILTSKNTYHKGKILQFNKPLKSSEVSIYITNSIGRLEIDILWIDNKYIIKDSEFIIKIGDLVTIKNKMSNIVNSFITGIITNVNNLNNNYQFTSKNYTNNTILSRTIKRNIITKTQVSIKKQEKNKTTKESSSKINKNRKQQTIKYTFNKNKLKIRKNNFKINTIKTKANKMFKIIINKNKKNNNKKIKWKKNLKIWNNGKKKWIHKVPDNHHFINNKYERI